MKKTFYTCDHCGKVCNTEADLEFANTEIVAGLWEGECDLCWDCAKELGEGVREYCKGNCKEKKENCKENCKNKQYDNYEKECDEYTAFVDKAIQEAKKEVKIEDIMWRVWCMRRSMRRSM